MENRKFLTVMAVFDRKTQEILTEMQSRVIENVGEGTQTMGIPFHLTLGSYPTEEVNWVVEEIKRVAVASRSFDVELGSYKTFSNKVLFLEPTIPEGLLALRRSFECDYANGFEWVPHATLFCGNEDEVKKALALLPELSEPLCTRIVGIELGEFFPARKIIRIDF